MALSIEIEVPQAVIFDQGTEKIKKEEKMIRLEPRLCYTLYLLKLDRFFLYFFFVPP